MAADARPTLDSALHSLVSDGFVVIPRELVGLTVAECAAVHEAQLREISRRFPGWDAVDALRELCGEVGKSLAGGFLGVQLLREQLELEFDERIKNLFIAVFSKINGEAYTGEVWVWMERSNVSFAEPLRSKLGQEGALAHIDDNPWATLDVHTPYDATRWEPKVRVAGLHEVRPMEKDRPVQAFIALTDCTGGPTGGGMGMSRERGFFDYLRTHTPPHGRNGHWGKLTRVYPKPGGAKLKALPKQELEAITAAHDRALCAIHYPSYRAGDVVLWLREILHAGPKGNDSGVMGARLYIGALPDNLLNRDAVRRQWEKLLGGEQAHGRARDRSESGRDIDHLLTPEQQRRAGAVFVADRAQPNVTVHSDKALFSVPRDAVGLGFKNATAVVCLQKPIDGLPISPGAMVFVKIGESATDAEFAVACSGLRSALGLASTPMCMVWVRLGLDWAAIAERANPKWGEGVRKRLRKALAESPVNGALPALVTSAFEDSCMVSVAPAEIATATGGGLELLRVLLFRKFVGTADTNGRNLLYRAVAGGSEILSVDETAANEAQLSRSAGTGLQTAQPINAQLIDAARVALLSQPARVAQCVRALLALELPAVVTAGGRLAAIHAKEPFDDATLAALDEADGQVLSRLAKRLSLGGGGSGSGGKRKRA